MKKGVKMNKTKNSFLNERQQEIIGQYEDGVSVIKLADKYKVSRAVMTSRLMIWEAYKPRGYGKIATQMEYMKDELIRDRKSGMTLRFLELKYGISHGSLLSYMDDIQGRIIPRKPEGSELDRLIEDLQSELFFLDELSHIYILTEHTILEIAYKYKLSVNMDYDDNIDFLMYDSEKSLYSILDDRKWVDR